MNGEEQPEVAAVVEEAPVAPAAAFEFGTLESEVSFTTRQVQPPALCYISPDDRLLIQAWNVLAGVVLMVNARILKPDGTLIQSTWTYTPTSAAALNEWRQGLAEGFLLTLSVDSAQAQAGACYVRVRLLRGAAAGLYLVSQTMVAGYVVRGAGLSWPYPKFVGPCEGPGRLRLIIGTDPAPLVWISETVPAGVRWKLVSISCQFTTTVAAGLRYVELMFVAGGAAFCVIGSTCGQNPNSAYWYTWAIGAPIFGPMVTLRVLGPLPAEMYLAAGQSFEVRAQMWLAGDDFGPPIYLVEEWVEP